MISFNSEQNVICVRLVTKFERYSVESEDKFKYIE